MSQALLAALPQTIPEICDPEIEWVEDPRRADGRVYRGHDGVYASWAGWLENFQEYGFEIERMRDHEDRVLVTSREGKILRYEEFYDERNALAALEP